MRIQIATSGLALDLVPETIQEIDAMRWFVERQRSYPVTLCLHGKPFEVSKLNEESRIPFVRLQSELRPHPTQAI